MNEGQAHIESDGEFSLGIPEGPTLEIRDADGTLLFQQEDGTIMLGTEPVGIGKLDKEPEHIHFEPPYHELVSRVVLLEQAVKALLAIH